jgi:hypothetical protein
MSLHLEDEIKKKAIAVQWAGKDGLWKSCGEKGRKAKGFFICFFSFSLVTNRRGRPI